MAAKGQWLSLADAVLEIGLLDRTQLARALAQQKQNQGRFLRVLVEGGFVDEDRLTRALASALGLEIVTPATIKIHERVLGLIPAKIALKRGALPIAIKRSGQTDFLYVAMADPLDLAAVDEVGRTTRCQISVLLAPPIQLENALARYYADPARPAGESAKTSSPASPSASSPGLPSFPSALPTASAPFAGLAPLPSARMPLPRNPSRPPGAAAPRPSRAPPTAPAASSPQRAPLAGSKSSPSQRAAPGTSRATAPLTRSGSVPRANVSAAMLEISEEAPQMLRTFDHEPAVVARADTALDYSDSMVGRRLDSLIVGGDDGEDDLEASALASLASNRLIAPEIPAKAAAMASERLFGRDDIETVAADEPVEIDPGPSKRPLPAPRISQAPPPLPARRAVPETAAKSEREEPRRGLEAPRAPAGVGEPPPRTPSGRVRVTLEEIEGTLIDQPLGSLTEHLRESGARNGTPIPARMTSGLESASSETALADYGEALDEATPHQSSPPPPIPNRASSGRSAAEMASEIARTFEVPIDIGEVPSPFDVLRQAEGQVRAGLDLTGIIPVSNWDREEFVPPPIGSDSEDDSADLGSDIPRSEAEVLARSGKPGKKPPKSPSPPRPPEPPPARTTNDRLSRVRAERRTSERPAPPLPHPGRASTLVDSDGAEDPVMLDPVEAPVDLATESLPPTHDLEASGGESPKTSSLPPQREYAADLLADPPAITQEGAIPLHEPGQMPQKEDIPTNPRMSQHEIQSALPELIDLIDSEDRSIADPSGDDASAATASEANAVEKTDPAAWKSRILRLKSGESLSSAHRAQLLLALGRILLEKGLISEDELLEALSE